MSRLLLLLLILTGISVQVLTQGIITGLPGNEKDNRNEAQLAYAYFAEKEYEKALVLYQKLFENDRNESYYNYYLVCLVELKEYQDAEKLIKKQIKKNPGKLSYMVDLGYTYTQKGDPGEGKKVFEEAISKLQPSKQSVVDLANAFLFKGYTNYAISAYLEGRKIIRTEPFHQELASIYNMTANYIQMIEEYLDLADEDRSKAEYVKNQLQNYLGEDPEGNKSKTLKIGLLKRIQKYPDNGLYPDMLLWYSVQMKDFEMALTQAKSIDKRNSEDGSRVYDLANLALSNEYYDEAIDAFNYVMRKGRQNWLYLNSLVGLLEARFSKITKTYTYERKDITDLETDYESALREFGRNNNTIALIRDLAHIEAFYLGDFTKATSLLNDAIEIPSLSPLALAECKVELADILLFSNDIWEATLLYSQVEKSFKNEPIGHMAKYKNARLSYYIGQFDWAKVQLDVLKAATSKLIANDALYLAMLISDNSDEDTVNAFLKAFSRADLLLYQKKYDQSISLLDSISASVIFHPILDDVLFKKASVYSETGRFTEASLYLEKVIHEFPDELLADDAMYQLAGLYEIYLGNKDRAMELYARLLQDYPGSLYVIEARKKYRTLRGDQLPN